ncbi:Hypothetical_protein [Hexamita inflata]|uniref:Hypothetical_protein n=1 Tax=Hexamita inflata TaxID=28002 RepID=A0AA86QBI6_9EUKA|nr:Hypothetical protein HINF_LOCUS37597 [Hexamita inflata]
MQYSPSSKVLLKNARLLQSKLAVKSYNVLSPQFKLNTEKQIEAQPFNSPKLNIPLYKKYQNLQYTTKKTHQVCDFRTHQQVKPIQSYLETDETDLESVNNSESYNMQQLNDEWINQFEDL